MIFQCFAEQQILLIVARQPLLNIRHLEDAADTLDHTGIDQIVHQLVVADSVIFVSAQTRTGVHNKGQQRPALRMQNFIAGELRRIGFVYLPHHLFNSREAVRTAIVVVDNPGRTCSDPTVTSEINTADNACDLSGMVIKPQAASGDIGDIGKNILFRHFKCSILQIFWMNELN